MPDRRSLILDGRTWAEVSLAALGEIPRRSKARRRRRHDLCRRQGRWLRTRCNRSAARALESAGASWLGVTDAAEGLALRGSGVPSAHPVDDGNLEGEEDSIVAQSLTPTIWEHWHIESLERAARQRQSVLPVHLKLDTGMNRLGTSLEALPRLCEMLLASKHLTLEGVSTHFASAEVLDSEDARRQVKRFEAGLATLQSYGLHPALIHMGIPPP